MAHEIRNEYPERNALGRSEYVVICVCGVKIKDRGKGMAHAEHAYHQKQPHRRLY